MQVVFHIGANTTEADRLLRALGRNSEALRQDGVCIPDPAHYRKQLQEAVAGPAGEGGTGQVPPVQVRDRLLAETPGGRAARRMILCNPAFLAWNRWVLARGVFYPRAASKVAALGQVFPGDGIELFLGLRNPATFVPAIWRLSDMSWDELTRGYDPLAAKWSDVVARIREGAPGARICVWCNEDLIFIWGTLLRRMAGVAAERPMLGDHDLLAGVVSPEGLQRFLSHRAAHPGDSEGQIRALIGDVLSRHVLPDAVEEEVDAPGWDAPLVKAITRAYDADVARIASMPGVEFIAP